MLASASKDQIGTPDRVQAARSPAGTWKPLRILYAEDHEQMAEMLTCALQRAGHQVEWAEDGQKAFDRIAVDLKGFDVLITDHRMPRLSGLELVEKIRGTAFPGKIIVHSSNLLAADACANRAWEVDHILDKPATLAALLAALEPCMA